MDLYQRSIELIASSQHSSGAYPAAVGYPTYAFSWIRDGSFIALAMDRVGEHGGAEAFHRWVAEVVTRYRRRIEALESGDSNAIDAKNTLHTRFTLEGHENSAPWENFQPDGYGFWLSALAEHLRATGTSVEPFKEAVRLAGRYLAIVWNQPSYDCWEEHPHQRHPATQAAIAAGLRDAGRMLETDDTDQLLHLSERITADLASTGIIDDVLRKFAGSHDIDASSLFVLGAIGPFANDDPVVAGTVDAVEKELVANEGGVRRYLKDTFYGGGLWVPLSGALAWVSAELGRSARTQELLQWIESTADQDSNLPEQVSTSLLFPERYQEWVDRWGVVARPLLWSHAMYLLAKQAAT